jgi:excisionase family DNA binding protein
MNTTLTLGEAARHCGVSKGTISKAIATGKLSATRREDGSWSIDGSELARYVETNGHRFRLETRETRAATGAADQVETLISERARADLAEARLADLREALADMKRQRDSWETQAQRLALTSQQPAEQPQKPLAVDAGDPLRRAWKWMRAAG